MELDWEASVVQTDRLGSIVAASCSTEPPNDAQTGFHTNANRGVLYNKSSYVDSKLILSATKSINNEIPLYPEGLFNMCTNTGFGLSNTRCYCTTTTSN